ncbi:hypothetical protein [Bacteroides helcogenes]|uniref:hypothetical protein n=1 Tax=Bacteroides helcogenes TaxID=290053 RepID=UPI0002DFF1ED|nr:hypothetical protein [Bacteroides helcogenes]MDY5237554.1 hypothetical protein [Bacteroides helcogenes]
MILDTDEALYIGLSSFVLGTILFLHVTDATEATGRNNVRWKLGVNGIFLTFALRAKCRFTASFSAGTHA